MGRSSGGEDWMMDDVFVFCWAQVSAQPQGSNSQASASMAKDARCEKGVRQDDLASSVGMVADMPGVESEAE